MDASYDLALFAVGLCSATFFWIAAVVQIEGDRQALVTRALTLTTVALGLLAFGDLVRVLFPSWGLVQNRLDGWLIAAIATGWYATAIYQTRRVFSDRRWPLARQLLWFIAGGGVTLALCDSIWPDRLHPIALVNATAIGPLGWIAIAYVLGALLLASVMYLRAHRIARRTWQRHRPEGHQRHRIGRWGLPGTLAALAAAISVLPIARSTSSVTISVSIFTVATSLLTLVVAALLLGLLTTNRALLGRPIHARRLFGRWLLLSTFFCALWLITWLDGARLQVGLLLVTLGAPAVLATLDLRLIRFYRETAERYRRFIGATITDWSLSGVDSYEQQMDAIFAALLETLRPDAAYLHIQIGIDGAPYERRHRWNQIPPRRPFSTRFDVRPIMAQGQEIGIIALYGPRDVAYSQLELDLAEAHAAAIASLYRAGRHAQAFEALVVEHDRRRQESLQTMHALLHDLLLGNLDVVHKGMQLLRPRLVVAERARVADLLEEVEDAAREAMATVRQTLLQQFQDLYPSTLTTRGLLAALRRDLLHYETRHPGGMRVRLEAFGLNDQELNTWLDDRLKRVLYGATEEAVRNAARHAGRASEQPLLVVVQVRHDSEGLTISVSDDGVGFVPTTAEMDGRGMGLRYQQAAMRTIGGTLQVHSKPHHGTEVRLHMPAPALCHQLPSCPFNPSATTIARTRVAWARVILDTERLSGGRLLVNDDLSDLTRPALVSERYYQGRATGLEYRTLLQIEAERQRHFTTRPLTQPYREIVDRRRLEHYIATGTTDNGRTVVGVELARQHVRAVIELLNKEPHYELALSDLSFETNFAIKPGHAVLWEQRAENGHSTIDGFLEGIRDTDSGTVANFEKRFAAAWERIPHARRDKERVIAWLENQLQAGESQQLSLWDMSPDVL